MQPKLFEEAKKLACAVMVRAHNPYSKYYVGAAIISKSDFIFTGCNIENASYGLTMCAERVAIFKAVSNGEDEFTDIFIATRDGGAPCGACRQVMAEFCSDDLNIHLINTVTNEIVSTTLGELLPKAFRVF